MTRTLIKVGDSAALILDPELESLTGLNLGDKVKVEIKSGGGITLIPLGRRSKKAKPRSR